MMQEDMAIANVALFKVILKALSPPVQQVRQKHSQGFAGNLFFLPFALTSLRNLWRNKKKSKTDVSYFCISQIQWLPEGRF